MKKRLLLSLLALSLSIPAFVNAAVTFDLAIASQSDNQVAIDVNISGLLANAAPSLAAYDMDVHFDGNHLAFEHIHFGDARSGNQLDLHNLGTLGSSAVLIEAGLLNVSELSGDSPDDLNQLQADRFTLATLTFAVLPTAINSQISLTINALSDAEGNELSAIASTPVTVASVPLPSGLWMMLSGLAGLSRVTQSRKRYLRQKNSRGC